MRMLVISDLHANWPALEAVLAAEPHDRLLVIGDVVSYGPHAPQVVECVRQHAAIAVRTAEERRIGAGSWHIAGVLLGASLVRGGRHGFQKGGQTLLERALLIALGGAIGSVLRFLTSLVAAQWFGAEFPYGTLIVNLSGAFVIGLVQEIGSDTLLIPDNARIFITTGMMGGLTTYSTFSYETVRLMETNAWHQAWINIVVTTTIALSLCFLGIAVGRLVLHVRG